MKILITGGAGYLGSVMVDEMLKEGWNVTVLDNMMFNQTSLFGYAVNTNFEFIYGDVRDYDLVNSLLPKFDVVIPLAALVGAPLCDRDKLGAVSINRDAVINIAKNISKNQKLLIPITNSGYGIGEKGKFCTEESPLRPISIYGQTKVEAEKAVLDIGNAISFRLATVFGSSPRMRIDLLVNDFVYRAVRDKSLTLFEGHFKRNYIHIRDVSNVFIYGIKNYDRLKGEPYNVGLSDANLSKIELCEKIKEYVPGFVYNNSEIGEDPDKRDYIVSNEKIEKSGWKPKYSLDDGIKELIKLYKMIKKYQYGNV